MSGFIYMDAKRRTFFKVESGFGNFRAENRGNTDDCTRQAFNQSPLTLGI
jgi:hypothetical protein